MGLRMEPVRLVEVVRLHATHADVAEDREEPDRVQGAAPRERKELRAGSNRELDHPHLAQLCEEEVPALVGGDQDQERRGYGDDTDDPADNLAADRVNV